MISNPAIHRPLFSCIQCGKCCQGYGGTYVSEKDIEKIAQFLRETPDDVKSQYCVASANQWLVAQKRDGYCVFYDNNCTIHPVKPRMCRQWPFIPNLVTDIRIWYTMAECCPGMRRDIELDDLISLIQTAIFDSK